MINANEHKKLLEKVTEFEKSNVNYFDVEKEFFLIDSDSLSQVRPKLYGYSVQRTGIYEDDNLTPEAIADLDGRGCYVYIDVKDGKITIKQDLNGSWGIYLFRYSDYFALSNSFFRLVDHVKFKYPLTVNRDYANYIVTKALCSFTYSDTIINEIQLLDRGTIIHIDIAKKIFETEIINYREYMIPLDSKEGINILDRWVEFWGSVFRNITQRTKFFTADLSGGFDTRISFALLLNSGIDLNKIQIYSIKGTRHTLAEDYAIASKIADHYGFKLNQPLPPNQSLNYSLQDAFNVDLYVNRTFSNLPKIYFSSRNINKVYSLCGGCGETLRYCWQMSLEQFMRKFAWKTVPYPNYLAQELSASIKNILQSTICAVRDKHKVEDIDFKNTLEVLHHETHSRQHFGKDIVCNYLRGNIRFAPALDPEVRTLRINASDCLDFNLLITLLFTRYTPDLLKFPFDSKRSIAPETIEYAKKINERFPRRVTTNRLTGGGVFHLQPHDKKAEKFLTFGRNNQSIPRGLQQTCLKAMFDSSRTFGLFTSYFDEELYRHAAKDYDARNFGYDRCAYSILGVTRVLEDVEISQRNHSPYQDMQRFIEQDFAIINNEEITNFATMNKVSQTPNKFGPYITARIDVKLMTTEGEFQIISVADNRASISKPSWFQKNGIGYVIQSYAGELNFTAKATVDGKIQLLLRGIDIRSPEDKTKGIPYWIDYTKLTINGKTIFDTLTSAWHNEPYRYTLETKAGEEIKMQVEWQPHRSDT
ncbi:MAG: hypothetical protein SR1Q5_00960 [Quinella sp. 1Q5]|nr:hypothetical protein [Quinella sp. 1Q5]